MFLDPRNVIDIKSLEKCRNIKSEIINYGVNESELLKLIELLSYELEDTNIMRSLLKILKPSEEIQEKSEKVKIEI